eukprot:CFRG4040T1
MNYLVGNTRKIGLRWQSNVSGKHITSIKHKVTISEEPNISCIGRVSHAKDADNLSNCTNFELFNNNAEEDLQQKDIELLQDLETNVDRELLDDDYPDELYKEKKNIKKRRAKMYEYWVSVKHVSSSATVDDIRDLFLGSNVLQAFPNFSRGDEFWLKPGTYTWNVHISSPFKKYQLLLNTKGSMINGSVARIYQKKGKFIPKPTLDDLLPYPAKTFGGWEGRCIVICNLPKGIVEDEVYRYFLPIPLSRIVFNQSDKSMALLAFESSNAAYAAYVYHNGRPFNITPNNIASDESEDLNANDEEPPKPLEMRFLPGFRDSTLRFQ